MPDDLALLVAEVDLIWGVANLGREPDAPYVVVADTGTVQQIVANPDYPVEPAELAAMVMTISPAYAIEPPLVLDTDAEVVLSGGPVDRLRELRPDEWKPEHWASLLAGRHGPWAMLLNDGQLVATCHAARFSAFAAEAGVWTAPAFRGRGYAAAVTAAWANHPVLRGRNLYYSTTEDNLSSQRVAARLGLRPLGHLRKYTRT